MEAGLDGHHPPQGRGRPSLDELAEPLDGSACIAVERRFARGGEGGFVRPVSAGEQVGRDVRALPGGVGLGRPAQPFEGGRLADLGAGVSRDVLERGPERRERSFGPAMRQIDVAAPDQARGAVLRPVQTPGIDLGDLAVELFDRGVFVAVGGGQCAAQPVKACRRKPVARPGLSILAGHSFPRHPFSHLEVSARHVHHRRLESGVGEVGIVGERALEGPQPRLAPLGVPQPVLVPPAFWFEADRPLSRSPRLAEGHRAGEQKRQRRVRLGKPIVQPDGPSRVLDSGRKGGEIGLTRRARHLVRDELCVRQPRICHGISGVECDRALEVGNRRAYEAGVETLDLQPALGVRPVGVEAGCFANAGSLGRRHARKAHLAGERGHDAILQREDVVELTVNLGVGDGVATRRIEHARGNPEAGAAALVTARHDELRPKRGRNVANRQGVGSVFHRFGCLGDRSRPVPGTDGSVENRPDPLRPDSVENRPDPLAGGGLNDAPAIDDAELVERGEVARGRLGDARRQPRDILVAGHVHEIQDGDRSRCLCCSRRHGRPVWRVGWLRLERADRGHEAVPAPRHRSDVGRRAGRVVESFAQLGNRLRQGVLRDVRAGPDGVEQLFLGDQRGRPLDEVKKEVEQLGRQVERTIASVGLIGGSVEPERPKGILHQADSTVWVETLED